MPDSFTIEGFDVVKRFDGSYAVYDFGWHPDPKLDADPELNEQWLERTQGWRAKSWQVVHVASSPVEAREWCIRNSSF